MAKFSREQESYIKQTYMKGRYPEVISARLHVPARKVRSWLKAHKLLGTVKLPPRRRRRGGFAATKVRHRVNHEVVNWKAPRPTKHIAFGIESAPDWKKEVESITIGQAINALVSAGVPREVAAASIGSGGRAGYGTDD